MGTAPVCDALGLSRATFYRCRGTKERQPSLTHRRPPARSLSDQERGEVLSALRSERFMDKAPSQIYAELLDEGKYLCSIRTMYRILDKVGEVRERRNQLRHPVYRKPELLATGPNQVWSWDIQRWFITAGTRR